MKLSGRRNTKWEQKKGRTGVNKLKKKEKKNAVEILEIASLPYPEVAERIWSRKEV